MDESVLIENDRKKGRQLNHAVWIYYLMNLGYTAYVEDKIYKMVLGSYISRL
jgi:hypothetical protein